MPSEVILPRVDMDMATGKISKWLVKPGSTVAKGQPLFEIETDKATMEIEAEANGTIRDLAEAGAADIPVGSVVAWIFGENEPAAQSAAKPVAPNGAPQPDSTDAPMALAGPVVAEAPSASPTPERTTSPSGRLRATPLARRLARMDGIDLGALTGSGPRGRIQAADVAPPRGEQIVKAAAPVAEVPALSPAPRTETSRPEARPAPVPRAPEPAASPSATTTGPQAGGLKRLRDGTGRPILLVHGFGAEANVWRPFLQGRPVERPVYGLDMPGHGGTPLGTLSGFADFVDAVEAALGDIDGADVVAHSLGGGVMTAVAARGQVDARSLLLIAPAGLGPEINGAFVDGFLAANSEAALTPWMAELVADPQAMAPSFVRATLKLRSGSDGVAAQRRVAAALFPDGAQSFSIRADLDRLRMPVRVLFGTADRIIPSRHAAGLPGLVALHLLPGVGHMPQMEAPDTVAAIMAQITHV